MAMARRRAGFVGSLGAAALLLAAAAASSGGVGPGGRVGSGVGVSAPSTTVNRLDSNLLDDPGRTIGPTLAAVAALDPVDAADAVEGGDGQDVPFSSQSRFRVVS